MVFLEDEPSRALANIYPSNIVIMRSLSWAVLKSCCTVTTIQQMYFIGYHVLWHISRLWKILSISVGLLKYLEPPRYNGLGSFFSSVSKSWDYHSAGCLTSHITFTPGGVSETLRPPTAAHFRHGPDLERSVVTLAPVFKMESKCLLTISCLFCVPAGKHQA